MLRLRQIAMVAPDLAPVEAEVGRIVVADVCYRDPGVGKYGLHNALWALGGTFLEALAPLQPGTTAGRYIERRGGATGYMVILDTDDLGPVRARLAALNVRIVEDLTVGDDHLHATALHLHPRDTGGCLLSIDYHGPDGAMLGSYRWAGADWHRHASADLAISGAVMTCDDPAATAARWGAILDRPATRRGDGWRIPLDNGALDFIPNTSPAGEGLAAIRVRGLDTPARTCGLDFLPETDQ
ncbi:VOC family protein [Sandarakinorhabdus oryzae]|uniref:VOC family protein n=1 Tax=Sandarakinorhabdus oryzae TaxID=2675220 RepID=UPI0012E1F1CD|nr:VOC family protein [Sandarakinorhabdus oryzae]